MTIQHWDPHPCGRVLIFPENTAVVSRAIEDAHDTSYRGRRDAGAMPFSDGTSIRVWSHVDASGVGIVCFGRVTSSGAHRGLTTLARTAEIDALERALEALISVAP